MDFSGLPPQTPRLPPSRPRAEVDRDKRCVIIHLGPAEERPRTREDRKARRDSLLRAFDRALAEFGQEFMEPAREITTAERRRRSF